MAVQTQSLKYLSPVASVVRIVKSPLRIPAWAVVTLIVMAGIYGYVSGRRNPLHHYVAYVGYPLVLDTTTGKACYSSVPANNEGALAKDNFSPGDASLLRTDAEGPTGPAIPLCAK